MAAVSRSHKAERRGRPAQPRLSAAASREIVKLLNRALLDGRGSAKDYSDGGLSRQTVQQALREDEGAPPLLRSTALRLLLNAVYGGFISGESFIDAQAAMFDASLYSSFEDVRAELVIAEIAKETRLSKIALERVRSIITKSLRGGAL